MKGSFSSPLTLTLSPKGRWDFQGQAFSQEIVINLRVKRSTLNCEIASIAPCLSRGAINPETPNARRLLAPGSLPQAQEKA